MKVKLIYGVGYQVFMKQDDDAFKVVYEKGWGDLINVFLKIYPKAKKADILELLEYMLMCMICLDTFKESDEILWFSLL